MIDLNGDTVVGYFPVNLLPNLLVFLSHPLTTEEGIRRYLMKDSTSSTEDSYAKKFGIEISDISYDETYDAYYNNKSGDWLEAKCNDEYCDQCNGRPDKRTL